jgi:hypothetical protein
MGSENGNLNIDLICSNETINLVKISARVFSSIEEQSYSIPYKILNKEDLEITDLNKILGTCQVTSSLGPNVASTKTFTITKNIIVAASLDKPTYNPGETIIVNVEATKANGILLNGFIEGLNASSFSKAIEEGAATEIFSMPETTEAGIYRLDIRAYDIGEDGILNEGSTFTFFNINQVPSSLIMSLSDVEVIPGNNFTIGTEVFDQSGIEMNGAISIQIISPNGEKVESNIQAGEFVNVNFLSNSSMGIWKIIGSFNDLVEEREFEMLEIQKAEFDLENSILTVKNTGNVIYNKTIDISIGEKLTKLELKINVGESRKFNLKAPNGEYEVVVNDGQNSISKQILLTGNSVGISNFKNIGIFKGYSIIWIFLIVIVVGVGIVLFMKYNKTRTMREETFIGKTIKNIGHFKSETEKMGERVGKKIPKKIRSHLDDSLNFTKKSPAIQGLDVKNYSGEDKSMKDFTQKNNAGVAEAALVLKGKKYISSVVAISVKNHKSLNDFSKNALEKIVAESKGRGLVDWRGDYIFVIFSPLTTKTYGNEMLAIKTGMNILKKTNEHNKKFNNKVEFNIGIHVGELVTSKVKENLKYTSIGNTISFAKRMADSDSGKLIVSEEIRKKSLRDLKVSKGKEMGDNITYIVSDLINREGDAARLKDLLSRSKN